MLCGGCEEISIDKNSVDFNFHPTSSIKAGDTIFFNNTSRGHFNCLWDFGDGMESQELNPTHVYEAKGLYCDKGEQHFRRHFAECFDFAGFNAELIGACASKHLVLALDPTHLPKSGKKTYGKDFFWSGCAGAVKPGLEFNGLAAVDIENHTAMHLEAQQTPPHEYLKKYGITLFDWYLSLVGQVVKKHPSLSNHLCADAFFSREPFVEGLSHLGINLISRLREVVFQKVCLAAFIG